MTELEDVQLWLDMNVVSLVDTFITCVILNRINYEIVTAEAVEEGKEAQGAPR